METVKKVSVTDITDDDVIIVLMGPTGTGKSTFIDTATMQDGKHVGHELKSCTSDVRGFRYVRKNRAGRERSVVLVDTPGFDDTHLSDMEVLDLIADWLNRSYSRSKKLSGIIYLHRINDNRMAGSPLRNLRMFQHLCGDEAAKNVVLTTTMWGKLADKMGLGEQRERELTQNWWKPMLDLGSSTERFNPLTYETAWTILDKIVNRTEEEALLLQEEMVELQRRLGETQAGKTLYSSLQRLLVDQKEAIRLLREQAEGQNNPQLVRELNAQLNKIEKELQKTFDQVKKMKIPLMRRIISFFSFRKARARPVKSTA